MKGGAENRKKTILAGGLGAVALCCAFYMYNSLFAGSSSPAPAPSSNFNRPAVGQASSPVKTEKQGNAAAPIVAPGVAATKMASTSSSLDPTLDEAAMLRTESLVYSGTGRNIFSLVYTPPAPKLPTNVPPPRTRPAVYVPPPPPPPPATCPPSCPPINLKFFGTETRANGVRQAFLLQGEDVYLASQGDIVARKYKIVSIGPNSVQVEDLSNRYTQTLPLATN